ncbi:hypothetical protein [Streptomyces sp. NBC_01803]|uniref:hypothetical protein n=1 Tax=Streptomyces sp. NBC_01803 TaxID=2975946 RepID=UPI002DDC5DE7|nr:hypothetical protein [Streptomyces sp. NBC_01803]WSA44385.1 hypothetical protein OIE51_09315 [Streptomyces sp. NBC_01803]
MAVVPSRRSLRLALCAGAMTLAAAAAAGSGPALAEDGPAETSDVRVEPVSPRPGDDVELRVPGCSGESGTARSAGFVAEARLTPAADGGAGLFGEARVSSTLEPGVHPIEVACDGEETKITGRLIITGADPERSEPTPEESRPEESRPEESRPEESRPEESRPEDAGPEDAGPTAPVRAGGGGTAPGPEDAATSMSGGTAGLALFSGALAGGAMLAVWRLHARER